MFVIIIIILINFLLWNYVRKMYYLSPEKYYVHYVCKININRHVRWTDKLYTDSKSYSAWIVSRQNWVIYMQQSHSHVIKLTRLDEHALAKRVVWHDAKWRFSSLCAHISRDTFTSCASVSLLYLAASLRAICILHWSDACALPFSHTQCGSRYGSSIGTVRQTLWTSKHSIEWLSSSLTIFSLRYK